MNSSGSFRSFAGCAPSFASSIACLVATNWFSVLSSFQHNSLYLPCEPAKRPCFAVLSCLRNMPLLHLVNPTSCTASYQFTGLILVPSSANFGVFNLRLPLQYRRALLQVQALDIFRSLGFTLCRVLCIQFQIPIRRWCISFPLLSDLPHATGSSVSSRTPAGLILTSNTPVVQLS